LFLRRRDTKQKKKAHSMRRRDTLKKKRAASHTSFVPSKQIFLLAVKKTHGFFSLTGFLRDTKKAVCAAARFFLRVSFRLKSKILKA